MGQYVDPVIWVLVGIILCLLSSLLWLVWLYVTTYRMYITANRDRDRLIRRIGLYHNIPLTIPQDTLPPLPPEAVVPPAFRSKKPTPPPGWKGSA